MTQVAEDIAATIAVLDERDWCQGMHEALDGKVCLEGAVIRAIVETLQLVEMYDLISGWEDVQLTQNPDGKIRTEFFVPRKIRGYAYTHTGFAAAPRIFKVFDALRREVPEEWVEVRGYRAAGVNAVSLYRYNDDPGTSREDIQLLLKRALETEEAKA